MNQGRTKMLLAALGVVALFAAWQWIGPALGMGGREEIGGRDDSGDFQPMGRVGALGQTDERPLVEEVVDLRIAELGGTARDFRPGRDPWRFKVPPPPPTFDRSADTTFTWLNRRSTRSRPPAVPSISMRMRLAASSIRSMALSGNCRSVI